MDARADDPFDIALAFTLRWEGGLVDDPADRGGATRWGISQRFLDSVLSGTRAEDLTHDVARRIYREHFWRAAGCEGLPEAVAVALFDTAVNVGTERAVRWLQRAVSARVDGILGPKSRAAVLEGNPREIIRDLLARRCLHYAALVSARPDQRRFLHGWFRRTADLAIYATRR